MKTIVAVSGGFDTLHIGHIELFKKAKSLGEDVELVVILNTDEFLLKKKGFVFMPLQERKTLLESIKYIDRVFVSIDKDNTVQRSIEAIKPNIFANGGDRHNGEIPEKAICDKYNIKLVDGLGDKIQSSQWLTNKVRRL
ncbi:MAG: adenylyltransferase/cytidyltransferase family protein [Cetobacterium sp.]